MYEQPPTQNTPQPQPPPYGAPTYQYVQVAPAPHGASIAALICGIFAILIFWIPFVGIIGLFLGIAALICGIVGLQHANGRGMAIAGVVCGGLVIALWVLGIIVFVAFAAHMS